MISIWAMDVLDDKYNTEVKMAAGWPDSACCALCRRKTVAVSHPASDGQMCQEGFD